MCGQRTRTGFSRTEPCGCCDERRRDKFDAEAAFKRLSKKYDEMAQLLAAYMTDAKAPSNLRSLDGEVRAPADTMAEALQRIVGGVPVLPGDFPECALIGRRSANATFSWFCTGVLIHPRIVVTAAHCFDPTAPINVVALNAVNQANLTDAEIISVRRVVVHPDYRLTGFHDISVLILRRAAIVKPARPATTQELLAANRTTLVGFGNDDVLSTRGFGVKREVTVSITHSAGTGGSDDAEQEFGFESDLEFVAGGSGFDSCNGDSGGPSYIDVDGEMVVAGLTSRATETARNPCGDGGIYTRVDVHAEFIKQVAASANIT